MFFGIKIIFFPHCNDSLEAITMNSTDYHAIVLFYYWDVCQLKITNPIWSTVGPYFPVLTFLVAVGFVDFSKFFHQAICSLYGPWHRTLKHKNILLEPVHTDRKRTWQRTDGKKDNRVRLSFNWSDLTAVNLINLNNPLLLGNKAETPTLR